MKFLRNLLAAVLGTFLALGLFFFFAITFLIAGASATSFENYQQPISVPNNAVLVLQLQKPILDHIAHEDFISKVLDVESAAFDLTKLIAAVEHAAVDDRIKGISIENTFFMGGMSQTQALRRALKKFKESGKFVYAYNEYYTQKDYYLASVADSLFLHPEGDIEFKGLASEVLYFKDFSEKTGIKFEVVRHGKYKSAVEPFIADRMSQENRTQIEVLLNSLWKQIASEIAADRQISLQELNRLAHRLEITNPKRALENSLVQKLLSRKDYQAFLKTKLEVDETETLSEISISKYMHENTTSNSDNTIAVVFAQGEIVYGEGDENVIGQEIIINTLEGLKKDTDVKAIVLRINSPGGSSIASELIWEAIEDVKDTKPVIVSMGDVAASGGYYIASGANHIVAETNTITGSIGVFGLLPNIGGLADDWGINAEQVGTHANSIGYSLFEPMSNAFRAEVKEGIEQVYNTFLERVANGRGLSREQVNKIAQGRVWSGAAAKLIGLVDEVGGLDLAVSKAAELSGVNRYQLKSFPRYDDDFERLFKKLQRGPLGGQNSWTSQLPSGLQPLVNILKFQPKKPEILTRMPFEISIR